MSVSLSLQQKELLNNVSKYEPAWRGFGNLVPGEGFGDKMQSMVNEINTLESQIDTSVVGFKELTVTNLSGSIIEIFDDTEEVFISDITIKVLNPFNTFASISIGTDFNNELLFASNESDLNEVIEYISFPKLTTSESIKLYFNNGGSFSGAAKVILNLG